MSDEQLVERLETELAERYAQIEELDNACAANLSELAEAKGDALSFEWAADRVRGAERELTDARAREKLKDTALNALRDNKGIAIPGHEWDLIAKALAAPVTSGEGEL